MDIYEYQNLLTQYTRSEDFVKSSQEEQQQKIQDIRDAYMAETPDANLEEVNKITEERNREWLRNSGQGRLIPSKFLQENNIILPSQKKGFDRLSEDEQIQKLEEFEATIPDIAARNPLQLDDTKFFLEQQAKYAKRVVNGKDRGRIRSAGSAVMEGFLATLAEGVGATDVAESMRDYFHENPEYDEEFFQQFSQGLGSAGSSIAIIAGLAATTKGLGGSTALAETVGSIGALGSNGIMRFNEGYRQAIEEGYDPDVATQAGLNAVPAAVIDVMGDRIIASKLMPKHIDKVFKTGTTAEKKALLGKLIKENTTRGKLVEYSASALGEGISEAAGDYLAAEGVYKATGDADVLPTRQESWRSFAIGAIIGGGINATLDIPQKLGDRKPLRTNVETGLEKTAPKKFGTVNEKLLTQTEQALEEIPEQDQQKIYDLLAEGRYQEARNAANKIITSNKLEATQDGKQVSDDVAAVFDEDENTEQQPTEQTDGQEKVQQQEGQQEGQQEQVAEQGKVVGFETAKGSQYVVNEDNTTTRNKAYRPEHGEKEQGQQPQSQRTVYVKDSDAGKVAFTNNDWRYSEENGKLVLEGKGKKSGEWGSIGEVEFSETPEVGMIPIELWNKGEDNKFRRVHFGNPITKLNYEQPAKQEQQAQPVEQTPQALQNQETTGKFFPNLLKEDIANNIIKTGEVGKKYKDHRIAKMWDFVRNTFGDTTKNRQRFANALANIRQDTKSEWQRIINEQFVNIKSDARNRSMKQAEKDREDLKRVVKPEEIDNQLSVPEYVASIESELNYQSVEDFVANLKKKIKSIKLRNKLDQLVEDVKKKAPNLKIAMLPDSSVAQGFYWHSRGTVYLGARSVDALAHEVGHALTKHDLNIYVNNRPEATYQAKLEAAKKDENTPQHIKALINVFLHTAKKLGHEEHIGVQINERTIENYIGNPDSYKFTSLDEFLAAVYGERNFQKLLHEIPYKGGSVWENIVEAIKNAFKWMQAVVGDNIIRSPGERTTLTASIAGIKAIIDAQPQAQATYGQTSDISFTIPPQAKIVEVDGYLERDGQIVKDDGGRGNIITQALQLPDGSLYAGTEEDIENVVYDKGLNRWGVMKPDKGVNKRGLFEMVYLEFPDSEDKFQPNGFRPTQMLAAEPESDIRFLPAQVDQDYFNALENNNEYKAKEVIKSIAKKQGLTKVYHGSKSKERIRSFDPTKIQSQEAGIGFFFTSDQLQADTYGKGQTYELYIDDSNMLYTNVEYPSSPVNDENIFNQTIQSLQALHSLSNEDIDAFKEYVNGKPNLLADIVEFNYSIAKFLDSGKASDKISAALTTTRNTLRGDNGMQNKLDLIRFLTKKDGIRFKDGYVYSVVNTNKIKSADAITYDDAGNIIPPSRRFNLTNNDIRFLPPEDRNAYEEPYANKSYLLAKAIEKLGGISGKFYTPEHKLHQPYHSYVLYTTHDDVYVPRPTIPEEEIDRIDEQLLNRVKEVVSNLPDDNQYKQKLTNVLEYEYTYGSDFITYGASRTLLARALGILPEGDRLKAFNEPRNQEIDKVFEGLEFPPDVPTAKTGVIVSGRIKYLGYLEMPLEKEALDQLVNDTDYDAYAYIPTRSENERNAIAQIMDSNSPDLASSINSFIDNIINEKVGIETDKKTNPLSTYKGAKKALLEGGVDGDFSPQVGMVVVKNKSLIQDITSVPKDSNGNDLPLDQAVQAVLNNSKNDIRFLPKQNDEQFQSDWENGATDEELNVYTKAAFNAAGFDTTNTYYRGDLNEWTETNGAPLYLTLDEQTAKDFAGDNNPRKFYIKKGLNLAKPPMMVGKNLLKSSSFFNYTGRQIPWGEYRLATGITSQQLINMGYDGIEFSMDGTDKHEIVLFNPNYAKLSDAVTFDAEGFPIPPSKRADVGNNDINFLPPNATRAQKDSSYLKKLAELKEGRINDKFDYRTLQMIQLLNRIKTEYIPTLDDEMKGYLFRTIENIYNARKSGTSNPALRWNSDNIIETLEAVIKATESTYIDSMIADFDGLIDFDGIGIDITDVQAVADAIKDYTKEIELREDLVNKKGPGASERMEKIYNKWRIQYDNAVGVAVDKYENAENYIREIEAINGHKISDPYIREMLVAHFEYLLGADVQNMVGKELYNHFYAINNLNDGNFFGLGNVTAPYIAKMRDSNEKVGEFSGKFRDPVTSRNRFLKALDSMNQYAELHQTQIQRLSAFEAVRKFVQEKLLGRIYDGVIRVAENRKLAYQEEFVAFKKELLGEGNENLTTEDRVVMSIISRLAQFDINKNPDEELLRNIKKERKSIDNIIARSESKDNRDLFRIRVKPLFETIIEGLEDYGSGSMQHFIDTFEERANGEENRGFVRKEMINKIQEIFSRFSLESKIVSEGFHKIPFSQQAHYMPNDVRQAGVYVENKDWNMSDPISAIDQRENQKGIKSKEGHYEKRSAKLGDKDYYSYNIESTLSRGTERLSVDHATISERFILAHRIKNGSQLNKIINTDEDGLEHHERVAYIERAVYRLISNAVSKGVPLNAVTEGMRMVTSLYARPTLSSIHHIVTQPLAALLDYAGRTGNYAGWLEAARYYAANRDRVNEWFKQNQRWTAERAVLEAMALDTRRSPVDDTREGSIKNLPMVKFLEKHYKGASKLLTFFIHNGDQYASKVTVLAEYARLLKEKGYQFDSFDDIEIGVTEGNILSQATLNAERNINTSNKILRGDLFTDRNHTTTVLRNLLFAFSAHSASLATQVNQAVRDILELRAMGASREEIGSKIRTIASITMQQVGFTAARYGIAALTAKAIIGLIRDLYDDEDEKIEELQYNVYRARELGNPIKVQEAESELDHAKAIRKVIRKIENTSLNKDSMFKQIIRDGSGSYHLAFNIGPALKFVTFVPDKWMEHAAREQNNKIIEQTKNEIRKAKERKDYKKAAKLEATVVDLQATEYIPLAYDSFGIGLGGMYGSTLDSYYRQANDINSWAMGTKEWSANDLALAMTSLGLGQSEISKTLKAFDKIEEEHWKQADRNKEKSEIAELKAKAKILGISYEKLLEMEGR